MVKLLHSSIFQLADCTVYSTGGIRERALVSKTEVERPKWWEHNYLPCSKDRYMLELINVFERIPSRKTKTIDTNHYKIVIWFFLDEVNTLNKQL